MKTKDVRPWWWWINPWLYIKRRDIAYDTALNIITELARRGALRTNDNAILKNELKDWRRSNLTYLLVKFINEQSGGLDGAVQHSMIITDKSGALTRATGEVGG